MTAEEVKSVIDEQRAQGLTDEQMLDAFYDMFKDGKMDKDDLRNVVGVMGYEFTPEFEQDNTESPINAKGEEAPAGGEEEVTKEEVEDAKEFEPGEERTIDEDEEGEGHSPDEEEVPQADETEETEETETEENGEDSEEERSKAKHLFGLD